MGSDNFDDNAFKFTNTNLCYSVNTYKHQTTSAINRAILPNNLKSWQMYFIIIDWTINLRFIDSQYINFGIKYKKIWDRQSERVDCWYLIPPWQNRGQTHWWLIGCPYCCVLTIYSRTWIMQINFVPVFWQPQISLFPWLSRYDRFLPDKVNLVGFSKSRHKIFLDNILREQIPC